jgi:opacity protein-like surface antigen
MKPRVIACCAILGTLFTTSVCLASPARPGAYMGGFIGISAPRETTATTDDFVADTTFTDRIEFDPSINAGIAGGYDFGYLRLEGELSYKHGSMSEITDKSDNYRFRNVDGDLGALAMMFNGYLDLRNDSPITPYVCGGVGFATLYISDTYGTDTRGSSADEVLLYDEDSDSVFAWQAGGGLEIALNSVLSLDLGYRYFRTDKARFDSNWDQTTSLRFESHNASIGLRVKF